MDGKLDKTKKDNIQKKKKCTGKCRSAQEEEKMVKLDKVI